MSAELLVFFVFAGLAVAGALNLVFQRHPVHSALSLILVMVSLAMLYLLLGAEFIAAIQVIVYAGAIMVLFLFVIMVLNAGEEEHTQMSRLARFVGLPLAAFFLLEAAFLTYRSWPSGQVVVPGSFVGSTARLGHSLFGDYLLPFELTGILILIALLGAVVLAKKDS
jgi:NADH-quinone oxidoreductase subunit J